MSGYNSDEVLRLLKKWPDVEPPIYVGPTEEELDSRFLAMAFVGAHAQNPSSVRMAEGHWVIVCGVIKSIGAGNVVEFDGHGNVGIPRVQCTILDRKELADHHLGKVITARGQIIRVQLDSSREGVSNIAIARAEVLPQEQR